MNPVTGTVTPTTRRIQLGAGQPSQPSPYRPRRPVQRLDGVAVVGDHHGVAPFDYVPAQP